MENPCRQCDVFLSGLGYDNDRCLNCKKRLEYIGAIGPTFTSMPVELMDISRERDNAAPAEKAAFDIRSIPAGGKENIVENPKTKVCSRKDCKHKGQPLPLDEFDTCRRNKDGKVSYCKSCRRRLQRNLLKKKKKSKGAGKSKKTTTTSSGKDNKKVVNVTPNKDTESAFYGLGKLFNGHDDLLDKLIALANAEMRTPRNQLLYMVRTASISGIVASIVYGRPPEGV